MTRTPSELDAVVERLEQRLDTAESTLEIERLAHRYAFAADCRDLEQILDMFIDDVDCGRFGVGRDALKASYDIVHRQFYRTVHQVVGHVIDHLEGDRAQGRVMMRAEHEVGDRWIVSMLCMFDEYERRDRQWYFVRRKPENWYTIDAKDRPYGPDWQPPDWSGRTPRLPHLHPTWTTFWHGYENRVDELSSHP